MPSFSTADVRRYYDRHTPAFLSGGQGGALGSMHRAVRGPGAATREQAFHYVEDQILERIRTVTPATGSPRVLDLGCGVAASLCYLAERLPITGTGITISGVQARIGSERIRAAGLSNRLACIEGDYGDLPPDIAPADVAYAIESFVHGPEPARFFEQCRRLVRPDGLLIVCDDVRRVAKLPGTSRTGAIETTGTATTTPAVNAANDAAERAIETFCRGWHITSLLDAGELRELAHASGFEHDSTLDLSPFLELRRPRDRAIALFLALVRWLPIDTSRFDPLVGGNALQTCLAHGWIGYDFAVFKRQG
ncbi:MAG: class I SAM-dependent methyltransferase [Vicinamibacterales bacterium]